MLVVRGARGTLRASDNDNDSCLRVYTQKQIFAVSYAHMQARTHAYTHTGTRHASIHAHMHAHKHSIRLIEYNDHTGPYARTGTHRHARRHTQART